jgi:hypothetical protein
LLVADKDREGIEGYSREDDVLGEGVTGVETLSHFGDWNWKLKNRGKIVEVVEMD